MRLSSSTCQMLNAVQVEYLVVTYKDSDPLVTLSLHQADILHALAQDEELSTKGGCVPDLQVIKNEQKYIPRIHQIDHR